MIHIQIEWMGVVSSFCLWSLRSFHRQGAKLQFKRLEPVGPLFGSEKRVRFRSVAETKLTQVPKNV